MTLRQYIRKNGWSVEVSKLKRFQSVDVSFIDEAGRKDETEFDISSACTYKGVEQLADLYDTFCKECGIRNDTVTAVRVVHSADSYEKLP